MQESMGRGNGGLPINGNQGLGNPVGGNPFGSLLPQLSDDAGTPFAVVVIPVDDQLAVGAR